MAFMKLPIASVRHLRFLLVVDPSQSFLSRFELKLFASTLIVVLSPAHIEQWVFALNRLRGSDMFLDCGELC